MCESVCAWCKRQSERLKKQKLSVWIVVTVYLSLSLYEQSQVLGRLYLGRCALETHPPLIPQIKGSSF